MGHFQCFLRMPDSASRISENSPPLQIRLRRHVNSSSNNRPSVEVLWAIRFRFQSRERQTAPRYSSSRASVLVSALRIMPLFIGTSLLLLFDFNGMAIGSRSRTARSNPTCPSLNLPSPGDLLSVYKSQVGNSSWCPSGSVDVVAPASHSAAS
jgi:hypothetical protein